MLDEFKNDTRVVHVNKEDYDVYIGRPSEWGNPYSHIRDKKTLAEFVVSTREEAISKYRDWILQQPQLLEKLESLRGKRLGCWCKKEPHITCHGDVLVELLRRDDFQ